MIKQIPNSNDQTSRFNFFGIWSLGFDWNLEFGIWSFVALLGVVLTLFFSRRFLRHLSFTRRHTWLDRAGIAREWKKIEQFFGSNNDLQWKLAVLEADKLLDHTLKSMAIPGRDLGERLKTGAYQYPGLRAAWEGHKIRNRLVHETTYHVSRSDATRAQSSFRSALTAVRVL